jgi:hypothetical protein
MEKLTHACKACEIILALSFGFIQNLPFPNIPVQRDSFFSQTALGE